MKEYDWQEVSLGFTMPRVDLPPDWVDRNWRERLLSWPWRPWVKQKPSNYFLMKKCRQQALDDMERITGLSVFHE